MKEKLGCVRSASLSSRGSEVLHRHTSVSTWRSHAFGLGMNGYRRVLFCLSVVLVAGIFAIPAQLKKKHLTERTTAGCERHNGSEMGRLVGAILNIAFLDGRGQMLCDVSFCTFIPSVNFEESAASPGRDTNPGHHHVVNAYSPRIASCDSQRTAG